jgi:chromosome segregation ATPase
MADTNDLLHQIRNIVREEVKAETEPIKTDLQTVKKVVNHISTGIEALAAGQQDMKENMATKADVQDIKADLVKHQRRIENLEENTKTPNPHKN